MNIIEILQANGNFIFVNLLLQITALCGIALLISWRFMNKAAARYNILFPAMLSLLLLTAFSIGLQLNEKSILFIPLQDDASVAANGVATEFILDEFSFEELVLNPTGSNAASPEVGSVGIESVAGSALLRFRNIIFSLPPYLIALVIWSGGFLFLAIGLLRSFHNIDRLSRRSRPLEDKERRYLDYLLMSHLESNTELHYRASDHISSPMLIGISQPAVLLPDRFIENLNESQLRSVLLHELAHYQRRDGLANFLQKIMLAIFWFHPLVHVLDRMLSRAREEICDNYVLNSEQAVNYGETLLQVNSFSANRRQDLQPLHISVGVMGSSWNLESRIRGLLNEGRDKTVRLNHRIRRVIQFVAVGLSVFLAACQIGSADSQELQDQALVLEEQSEQLLQERQRLQEQTSALENQLRNLRKQLQRREESEQDAVLSKEEILRSITELQTVMMEDLNTVHFDDITELTKRLLQEILRKDQQQMVLNRSAIESMQEILAGLDDGDFDYRTLRGSIIRLGALTPGTGRSNTGG